MTFLCMETNLIWNLRTGAVRYQKWMNRSKTVSGREFMGNEVEKVSGQI